MTKAQLFTRDLHRKRREISHLQEDLANLKDHFLVLEARARNAGKQVYSPAQVRTRLNSLSRS